MSTTGANSTIKPVLIRTSLNYILSRKVRNAKNKKQNGFTLIELMVVVAIVAILSAVGLPELTKAQDQAKSSAALAHAVNESKSCSVALLASTTYTLKSPPTDVTADTGNSCAKSGTIKFTGGNETHSITFDANGIPGDVK